MFKTYEAQVVLFGGEVRTTLVLATSIRNARRELAGIFGDNIIIRWIQEVIA